MCADPSVDVLVCALTGFLPGITDDFAGDILAYMRSSETPVVVTWNTCPAPSQSLVVMIGVCTYRKSRAWKKL